jgi:ABC-2 type transport system permease protein
MYRFITIFKMDLKNTFKNPVLVGYNSIFILLLTSIMGFLTGGGYADSKSAYQYYTISFIIYGILNGAMTASNCFMERDIKRANLRIIYSPAGNFPIYFSKIAASFLFDYILHAAFLVLYCLAMGLQLGSNPAYFLILMIPVEFASASLGIFFCCLLHSEEATSSLLSTLISLLAVLGGTFFSLDGLGHTASTISHISPVKWLNKAFFQLAIDNDLHLFWYVFGGSILISILLIAGCKFTFKTEDYL